jgi:hypothetical protein
MRGAASWAVGLGLALQVSAADVDQEGRIVLTAEERRTCVTGGGCVMLTATDLANLLTLARRGSRCSVTERKGSHGS